MSTVISVINWKGGVGKTTLTHHIGIKLQDIAYDEKKYPESNGLPKTLLIDLDPQCNLSIACLSEATFEHKVYGSEEPIKTVKNLFELYLDNKLADEDLNDFILKRAVRAEKNQIYVYVDLLPAHPDLIYTDMEIATFSKRDFRKNLMGTDIYKFQIVHSFIKELRKIYDFILIDCPPNLNYVTQNALYESDYYLIPTRFDKLSSYGILSITNKVNELNEMFSTSAGKEYNPIELAGIIGNNIVERYGSPKATQANIQSLLKSTFGNVLFDNYLTEGDGIAKASEQGYPVFALDGKKTNATKQTKLINKIVSELWDRIK